MKAISKINSKTKSHTAGMGAVLLLMLIFIIACEKTNDNPKYNPPADHTISKNGYLHKSGLNLPLTNCVSCHGSDLMGGTTGVSCYECHNKKW